MVTRREWLVYTGATGLAAATGALSLSDPRASVPASTPASADLASTPVAGGAAPCTPDRGLSPLAPPLATTPEAPPPWWAFAPFREGSALAAGWSLASLSPVREGRAVLVLEHEEGSRAEIHVRRHEPSYERPEGVGIAQSQRFDFILMNGSRGDRDTREILGRVIVALAIHVRRNELSAPEEAMASFTAHRDSSQGASLA